MAAQTWYGPASSVVIRYLHEVGTVVHSHSVLWDARSVSLGKCYILLKYETTRHQCRGIFKQRRIQTLFYMVMLR